jgi:aminoglycoside phosphotransferase (APT) family kinase protein
MSGVPNGNAGEILAALRALDLIPADAAPVLTPLSGGVSSDVWRVQAPGVDWCVKRALPKLKVQKDWFAPIERNRYEAEWLRVAGEIAPDNAPALIGADAARGLLVMAFLPHEAHPLWKARLAAGDVDPGFAADVGRVLGRIHAASAGRADIARRFDSDAIFHPIRLEPYLLATGEAHPDLAPALAALADRTATTKRALVHGDVSPKNILIGPRGPVILDAECAWYGDPAFDLAFCLNHLLLKWVLAPDAASALRRAFAMLADAYLSEVSWEPAAEIEDRAARLLPGLLLARVDGKSPVEYIQAEADRALVRAVARPLIARPVARLAVVADAWRTATAGIRPASASITRPA